MQEEGRLKEMAKVTVIPSTINPITKLPNSGLQKRKVAGYARVSTDLDEQFSSYQAQVDYYTNLIKRNPEWEFVEVYTDEGISGTNTKRRDGFNRMIQDALNGKIDLILTKSVSRFARNTVDSLTFIRKLKEKGVEVFFEKENIYTFDSKGELLITIMSSLAQEESRSISENVTWGKRKSFSDGKVSMPYKHFLGYKKGEDGKPAIDEEEAHVVKEIYSLFLRYGYSTAKIAKEFNERGIATPSGKGKWTLTTIESILSNEKYKGDALLQKKYVVDFLTHKAKVNEGEIPQYYVENSHPAIIDKVEWDLVQAELERRKQLGKTYSSKNIFASKLVCEDCGSFFGRKVWHSTDEYRAVVYQCNGKFKSKDKRCETPILREEEIKAMFLKAYNKFVFNKASLIDDSKLMIETITDVTSLDEQISKQIEILENLAQKVKELVSSNASTPELQTDYLKEYDKLCTKHSIEEIKYKDLIKEKDYRLAQAKSMELFIKAIEDKPDVIDAWDDNLWILLIKKAIVHHDKSITFVFNNLSEITIAAE